MVATTPKQELNIKIKYTGNCKILPYEIKQLLEQNNRLVKDVEVEILK